MAAAWTHRCDRKCHAVLGVSRSRKYCRSSDKPTKFHERTDITGRFCPSCSKTKQLACMHAFFEFLLLAVLSWRVLKLCAPLKSNLHARVCESEKRRKEGTSFSLCVGFHLSLCALVCVSVLCRCETVCTSLLKRVIEFTLAHELPSPLHLFVRGRSTAAHTHTCHGNQPASAGTRIIDGFIWFMCCCFLVIFLVFKHRKVKMPPKNVNDKAVVVGDVIELQSLKR